MFLIFPFLFRPCQNHTLLPLSVMDGAVGLQSWSHRSEVSAENLCSKRDLEGRSRRFLRVLTESKRGGVPCCCTAQVQVALADSFQSSGCFFSIKKPKHEKGDPRRNLEFFSFILPGSVYHTLNIFLQIVAEQSPLFFPSQTQSDCTHPRAVYPSDWASVYQHLQPGESAAWRICFPGILQPCDQGSEKKTNKGLSVFPVIQTESK